MKTSTSKEFTGELFLGTNILFWASFPLLVNISTKTLPPLFFAGTSFLIAGILSFITLLFRKEVYTLFQKKGLRNMIISTFLVVVCVFSLLFVGGQQTTPGNMALLRQTKIIFTLLFFGVLGLEVITKKRILTAVFVIIGTSVILWESFSQSINQGDILILLSCAFLPVANYFQKKALKEVSSFTHLCFRSLFGGMFVLGLSFLWETTPLVSEIQENLWLILANGIFVLWLSQIAFLEALKRLDVSKIMIIVGINPAITLFLAFLFLGIIPSVAQIVGFFIIFTGLILGKKKK